MKRTLIIAVIMFVIAPCVTLCAQTSDFSWQKALENAKQNTRRGITLKSYKVQGKVRSKDHLEKLIDSWYSDESYIVIVSNKVESTFIVIAPNIPDSTCEVINDCISNVDEPCITCPVLSILLDGSLGYSILM